MLFVFEVANEVQWERIRDEAVHHIVFMSRVIEEDSGKTVGIS